MNLYGYAGGDPINRSDPFGLCSAASDSIQIEVVRDCGNGKQDTVKAWAHQATAAERAAIVGAAGRLTGGDWQFTPAQVGALYSKLGASGDLYVFPNSNGGFPVLSGGVTSSAPTAVSFRRDVMNALSAGSLTARFGITNAISIVGHEGVHLMGELNENIAWGVTWGVRTP